MYKQGVRSMPKYLKSELLSISKDAKSIDDIMPIEKSEIFSQNEIDKIVRIILSVRGLPSFWLVSIADNYSSFSFYLIFEKKINSRQAASLECVFDFNNINLFCPTICLSDNYGIY